MMWLVVDTSMVRITGDHNRSEFMDATEVLAIVRSQHGVVLDVQGKIREEWIASVSVQNSYAARWVEDMLYGPGRVMTVHGELTRKQLRCAVDGKCDPSDFAFLAASCRSSAPIIHEDSDYEFEAVAELGITQYRAKDALTVLRDPTLTTTDGSSASDRG